MYDTLGLYLHIPFCIKKCAYCDFYSLPCCENDESADGERQDRYAEALLLHMQDYAQGAMTRDVDTVFIGGGTPTLLDNRLMLDLIKGVKQNFNLLPDAEFTMEANPATVTYADLRRLRKAGVNRLSIGLQSIHADELSALSRIHTYEDFEESYNDARRAGFENINVDLMYGIPAQTRQTLRQTLEKVVSLEPEHISLYNLILEEGTPLYAQRDSLTLPDEDAEYEMYESSVIYLESHGYHQYEISNFAKDGFACRHNLKYWNCEEYLGFGPGAHSYYNERRFSYKRDLDAYLAAMEYPESGTVIIDESYDVRPSERIGEYVMLRMRLKEGVDTAAFAERFGVDFERLYGKYLKLYTENGFMTHTDSRYAFTLKGMYVSNTILSTMIDFDSPIAQGITQGTDGICVHS